MIQSYCLAGDRTDVQPVKGYAKLLSAYTAGSLAGAAKSTTRAPSPSVRRTTYDSSALELSRWSSMTVKRDKLHASTPDIAKRSQIAEQKHIMRQASITESRRMSGGFPSSSNTERSRPSTAMPSKRPASGSSLSKTYSNASTTDRSVYRSTSLDMHKGKSSSRSASPSTRDVAASAPAAKPHTIAAYKPAKFGRSSLSTPGTGPPSDMQSFTANSNVSSSSGMPVRTVSGLNTSNKVQSSSAPQHAPVNEYTDPLHKLQQEQQQQKRSKAGSAFLDRVNSSRGNSTGGAAARGVSSSSGQSNLDHDSSHSLYPVDSSSGKYDR